MTERRAFRVAYDGRPYRGFQRQPDQPTVEDDLLAAFEQLDVDPLASGYAAAGRTDAGVSAIAQTVALDVPGWLDPHALNGALPPAIFAWASAAVDASFHPRHHAAAREYTYVWSPVDVDLDRLEAACDLLEGTNDVRHLTADREKTVRSVTTVDVERTDPHLRLTVRAPGFLRQQVRRTATLLTEVGRGERGDDELVGILSGEPLPGHRGIRPAAPEGLLLTDVHYPEVRFGHDERAVADLHVLLRDRATRASADDQLLQIAADALSRTEGV